MPVLHAFDGKLFDTFVVFIILKTIKLASVVAVRFCDTEEEGAIRAKRPYAGGQFIEVGFFEGDVWIGAECELYASASNGDIPAMPGFAGNASLWREEELLSMSVWLPPLEQSCASQEVNAG